MDLEQMILMLDLHMILMLDLRLMLDLQGSQDQAPGRGGMDCSAWGSSAPSHQGQPLLCPFLQDLMPLRSPTSSS